MQKHFNISNKAGVGEIRLVGEISWWNNSGKDFMRKIDSLISQGVTDIEVYINTGGGDMFEANEIGNQLLRFSGTKTEQLGAICASAGTGVSTYLDKVIASSNTQYMIHDPLHSIYVQHEDDFDSNKKLYQNLRNNVIDRYAAKTGLDKEVISDMMKKTTWMNADEAKKKGFVDEISNEEGEMPADTQNVFNKYNYAIPSLVNQAIQNTNLEQNKKQMDKEVLASLGLPENATSEQVQEAIKNLKENQKPTETPSPENSDDDKKVTLLMSVAESKGMDKDAVKNAAEKDFDLAHDMVMAAPNKQNPEGGKISDVVAELKKQNAGNGTPSNVRADWDLKKWEKEDQEGLKNMIENNFDEYAKLFNKAHGFTPTKEDVQF